MTIRDKKLSDNGKPESLNIMGIPIKVVYCENIADVDPVKRELVFGNADLKNNEIRVYDGSSIEFTWQTLIHEALHIIGDMTKLDMLTMDSLKKHNELDCLANVLADTLLRNNLLGFQTDNRAAAP